MAIALAVFSFFSLALMTEPAEMGTEEQRAAVEMSLEDLTEAMRAAKALGDREQISLHHMLIQGKYLEI